MWAIVGNLHIEALISSNEAPGSRVSREQEIFKSRYTDIISNMMVTNAGNFQVLISGKLDSQGCVLTGYYLGRVGGWREEGGGRMRGGGLRRGEQWRNNRPC